MEAVPATVLTPRSAAIPTGSANATRAQYVFCNKLRFYYSRAGRPPEPVAALLACLPVPEPEWRCPARSLQGPLRLHVSPDRSCATVTERVAELARCPRLVERLRVADELRPARVAGGLPAFHTGDCGCESIVDVALVRRERLRAQLQGGGREDLPDRGVREVLAVQTLHLGPAQEHGKAREVPGLL